MSSEELEPSIALLASKLTSAFVENVVRELLQQRQDRGSGVAAVTLVMHLVGDLTRRYTDIMSIYQRLRPALRTAVEQSASLQFLEGG